MSITIALAQMSLTRANPELNFKKVKIWIHKASDQGAEIILLPELWTSGYDLKNCDQYASLMNKGHFSWMSTLAKEHKIAVGGSLIEEENGSYFNTFAFYDKNGSLIGRYRKIHLFGLIEEDQYFLPGDQTCLIATEWGKVGLATCYDLRFPELFRSYAVHGAELILLVAEWPQRRVAHWRQLLLARAIENQYFVAAVNKTGESQGERLGGYSAIISPMGEYLVEGKKDEELLITTLDLKETEKIRKWMPVLQDRRPEVFNKSG